MSIFMRIVMGIGGLLLILLVVGFLLPSQYHAERSIVINAPQERLFNYVNDLRKRLQWSPWEAEDPNIKITFGSITLGKGASYSWKSNKHGHGTLTITKSQPYSLIVTDIDFGDQGEAEGTVMFEEFDSGVRVTWSMSGNAGMNLFKRYFGAAMDYFVGPYFERGLSRLKTMVEALEPVSEK